MSFSYLSEVLTQENRMRLLLFDNYDSFTYNLRSLLLSSVQDLSVTVRRNKDRSVFDEKFDALIISPGPMTWTETGVLKELFNKRIIPEQIPVLGICLGFQFIAGYFGYKVDRIENPVHGSTTEMIHYGDSLFSRIPSPFKAARYNSLGLRSDARNEGCLEYISFEAVTNNVMALKHKALPIAGFLFHPESFMTGCGQALVKNFTEVYVKG